MIITISGMPGSGKSSTAKAIAKKIGYKHFSMGDLQRMYAKERGITIEELGQLEAKDDTLDRKIDQEQTNLAKKHDNFIIDSWLGFHFIPKSYKIFLDCDLRVGAERIYNDTIKELRDSSERKFKDIEHALEITTERLETNRKRWLNYYNEDFMDQSNYDLIIDESNITVNEGVDQILAKIKDILD